MDRGSWRAIVYRVAKSDMPEQLTHAHTPIRKKKKKDCFWWYLQGIDNTLNNVTEMQLRSTIHKTDGRFGSKCDQCEATQSNSTLTCRLRWATDSFTWQWPQQPWSTVKRHETHHTQRSVEGTRNRCHCAMCTAAEGSGCVTFWRWDPGVTWKLLVLLMWRSVVWKRLAWLGHRSATGTSEWEVKGKGCGFMLRLFE